MGRDVDGLCALLRAGRHTVETKRLGSPRLEDVSVAGAEAVLQSYRALGGVQESPTLRPGPWDLRVDGVLVELDEQLHFNRYRETTLTAHDYGRLGRFPLAEYRGFCRSKKEACLKFGTGQGRWTTDGAETQFGPAGARGDLSGAGAPRWKQRAVYDLFKDVTQLCSGGPRLARIAIWDPLPGMPDTTVEEAVHSAPSRRLAEVVWALIVERAGVA